MLVATRQTRQPATYRVFRICQKELSYRFCWLYAVVCGRFKGRPRMRHRGGSDMAGHQNPETEQAAATPCPPPVDPERAEFVKAFDPPESEANMSRTIYISPLAFLRSMAAIAWSAIRHPRSYTTVDLCTGRVISRHGARQ